MYGICLGAGLGMIILEQRYTTTSYGLWIKSLSFSESQHPVISVVRQFRVPTLLILRVNESIGNLESAHDIYPFRALTRAVECYTQV